MRDSEEDNTWSILGQSLTRICKVPVAVPWKHATQRKVDL
jgi:hypothetical protein